MATANWELELDNGLRSSELLVRVPDAAAAPSRVGSALKRTLDVTGALVILILASPLLLVAVVGVRLTSPGPAVFKQVRVGRFGALFTMYKIRTFPVDHVDTELSLPHASSPVRFCRFLRRTSIDELPQMINVLLGNMSLVGPRPERPQFVAQLSEMVPGYSQRHRLPAGVTGLAQVHGYWGSTSMQERIEFDNSYIDHWSIGTDLRILLRTLPAVVRKSRS